MGLVVPLVSIYELYDPVRQVPFYVGQTADSIERRLENHVKECCGSKRTWDVKERWIREIIFDLKVQPEIRVIELVSCAGENHGWQIRQDQEMLWIILRLMDDCPLTNVSFQGSEKWGVEREKLTRMSRENLVMWAKATPRSDTAGWILERWRVKYSRAG